MLKQLSQPPCSPQGTPADVLYKGTITRLITEDSASRMERDRDEVLSKGQVVYEGISAHILTFDRKYKVDRWSSTDKPNGFPQTTLLCLHAQAHLLRPLKTRGGAWLSLGNSSA